MNQCICRIVYTINWEMYVKQGFRIYFPLDFISVAIDMQCFQFAEGV